MQGIKIKICGMRDANNIMDVAMLPIDFMGFIFYAKSPRFVGDDFELPTNFPTHINKVGVFVNESFELMMKQVNRLKLDYVQLHGNESIELCELLKAASVKIIKVFSVDDDFDFEVTKPFTEVVDYFLFDTKGKYYGGNAQTFNWEILNQYTGDIPFFLSGGLNATNVSDVSKLKDLNVFALDLNSGVEERPGVKDLGKVRELLGVGVRI